MVLEPYVLAVDPGRDKTGVAILTKNSSISDDGYCVYCISSKGIRIFAGYVSNNNLYGLWQWNESQSGGIHS